MRSMMDPEMLTKMQLSLIAHILTLTRGETLYLQGGQISSLKSLADRGLIKQPFYSWLTRSHLTDELIGTFFLEHPATFRIKDGYGSGWIVFDNRQLVSKFIEDESIADRVVSALKLLNKETCNA